MRCPHCENPLRDNSRFCDKCGAPLLADSPSTAMVIRASSDSRYYGSVNPRPYRSRPWVPRHWLVASVTSVLLLVVVLFALTYYRARENTERFNRGVRCVELARDFASSKVTDQAEVIRVLYSSKRNSCLATVEHRNADRFFVQIVDPSTGEVIWVAGCYWQGECSERLVSNIQLE